MTLKAWAALEVDGRGQLPPCPYLCLSYLQEKFWWWWSALWALYYAKVWLIKGHFARQRIQISAIFWRFQIWKKKQICGFHCTSKSFVPSFPDQGLCPWIPLHLCDAQNNWIRSTFGPNVKKLLPFCALGLHLCSQLQILSPAHGMPIVRYCGSMVKSFLGGVGDGTIG